jgi:hypothetical protein
MRRTSNIVKLTSHPICFGQPVLKTSTPRTVPLRVVKTPGSQAAPRCTLTAPRIAEAFEQSFFPADFAKTDVRLSQLPDKPGNRGQLSLRRTTSSLCPDLSFR